MLSNAEYCPLHPDHEPVWVATRAVSSHQDDHPVRIIGHWTCTIWPS